MTTKGELMDGDSVAVDSDRLIPVAEGWALWPIAMLRSAGLPVRRLREFTEAAEEAGRDAAKLRAVLGRFAGDRWLLEALSWQNPAIVNTWLLRYGADDAGSVRHRPASYRSKLLALGSYIQRYSTKNETVGFYGPTGWAVVDPDADSPARAEGSGDRIWSHTAFEPWALEALANRWAADPEVRWHLPVVANQAGVLDGEVFHRPRRRPLRLTADQKAVIEALADRPRHAAALLDVMRARSSGPERWTRERLVPLLADLHKADCLWWGFELPVERGLEARVVAQLSELPDGALRSELSGQLAHLLRLRDEVADALGNADQTILAMNRLGEAFEEAAGVDRAVLKKDNPASRTLLYHDVAVDWNATVGARSVAALGGALELLMAVCRYISWRLACEIDTLARKALADGDDSFEAVFDELAPVFSPEGSGAVSDRVMADVHARVDRILQSTEPRQSTDDFAAYRSAALREPWLEAFTAPRYGWSAARIHSPDMMLARDGDRQQWVLGELHMSMNPLDYRFTLDGQPRPGQLERLIDAATSQRFIPAFPPWSRQTPRLFPQPAHHLPDKHRYWSLWSRSMIPSSVPKLSCVGLTVADRDGEVLVLDRDGQVLARLADFLAEFLISAYCSTFSLRPKTGYQRRLVIDDVVVHRRTWQFPVRRVPPIADVTLTDLFASEGIPRYTFVRIPGEPKPVFCDARSSITTDNVVRMLRKLPDAHGTVQVQEMIPDPEHLWLRGDTGDPVTSEFRFVVQDLRTGD